MRRTWAGVSWCLVGSWLCCVRAFGQPVPHEPSSWLSVAPGGDPCIVESELVRDVQTLLGSDGPPTGVRVHVQTTEDGFQFVLTHGSGVQARRELAQLPEACAARREALSLVLALAVEHALAEQRRAQEATAVLKEILPEPPPSRPQPETPVEASAPASARGLLLSLLGGLDVGLLPRPTAQVQLAGELTIGRYSELVASGSLSSVSRSSLGDGELWARALWGAMGACGGGPTGTGRLFACLSVGLGAVVGSGHGLMENRRDTTASGTLSLGVSGRWPLREKLWLVWRLSGFTQWLRPRYEVVGAGTGDPSQVVAVTTFPRFGGRALLGIAWQVR